MSNFEYNHLEFTPTPEQIASLPEHMDSALKIYNGDILSCEAAYQAIQRCIYEHIYKDEIFGGRWKFYSDPGRKFVKFVESIPMYEGPDAGEKFHTMFDWQKFLMCETEGWRDSSDPQKFRYNDVFFEVGKGAGKTTLMGFRMLYALLTGYDNMKYYSIATSEKQSKESWEHAMKAAYMLNDTLARDVGSSKTVLEHKKNGSKFEFLSGSPTSLDGKNAAILLVDEAAAIDRNEVIDKIKLSQGKQKSGRTFFTTHPQWNTTTYYYGEREKIISCLKGDTPMNPVLERTFAIFYQLDDKSEIEDDSTWVKAQPGIGYMPSFDWMKAEYESRKHSPTNLRAFEVYNFGIWQKNETAWLDPDLWDASSIKKKKLKELNRSGKCYIGVDLAERQDLSAVVRVWPVGGRTWHCDWKFWSNDEVLNNLKPDLKAKFLEAKENGILDISPGGYTEQGPIIQYVLESHGEYNVEAVAVDAKFAHTATKAWVESGIETFTVYQGHTNLADSVDMVESRIVSEDIIHDGNKFLKWQLANCQVRTYPDGKKAIFGDTQAHENIDGFASLLTASKAVIEPEIEKEIDFFVHVG